MIKIDDLKEKMNPLDYFIEDFPTLSEHDVKRKKKFNSVFSNDKTPSFNFVYGENGEVRYNCYSTGKNGDGIKYIMDRKQLSFPEALKYLNEKIQFRSKWQSEKNSSC